MQILSNNKKAYFDYFIEEEYEAGLELKGTEVKSIKMTKVSIIESFIRIMNHLLWGCLLQITLLVILITLMKQELESYYFIKKK